MWRTVIHGSPVPKGSLQPWLQWIAGKPVARVREDEPKGYRAWMKLLKAGGGVFRAAAGDQLLEGPLRLTATVTLARPPSVSWLKRLWPWKKPDADKLARAILDGLGSGGAYGDDAQICDLHIIKCYPDTTGVIDRLDAPGAVIRLGPIEDLPVKLDISVPGGDVLLRRTPDTGQIRLITGSTFGDNYPIDLDPASALQLARALEHEAREAERVDDQEVLV